MEAGSAGGLTSVSREVHLQVRLAGPRRRGRVPPPRLLLGRLLHLLVVVVPEGSRAGVRDSQPGRPGPGRGGRRATGWDGTGRADSAGCGARSRGSCPVARQACNKDLPLDSVPLPSGELREEQPSPQRPPSLPESSGALLARLPAQRPDLPPGRAAGPSGTARGVPNAGGW